MNVSGAVGPIWLIFYNQKTCIQGCVKIHVIWSMFTCQMCTGRGQWRFCQRSLSKTAHFRFIVHLKNIYKKIKVHQRTANPDETNT